MAETNVARIGGDVQVKLSEAGRLLDSLEVPEEYPLGGHPYEIIEIACQKLTFANCSLLQSFIEDESVSDFSDGFYHTVDGVVDEIREAAKKLNEHPRTIEESMDRLADLLKMVQQGAFDNYQDGLSQVDELLSGVGASMKSLEDKYNDLVFVADAFKRGFVADK